jgi:hypothetical protein
MSKQPYPKKQYEELTPHELRRFRKWQLEQAEEAERRAAEREASDPEEEEVT